MRASVHSGTKRRDRKGQYQKAPNSMVLWLTLYHSGYARIKANPVEKFSTVAARTWDVGTGISGFEITLGQCNLNCSRVNRKRMVREERALLRGTCVRYSLGSECGDSNA
jgi:hypothetical protein